MHRFVEHSHFCYCTPVRTSSWTAFQHDPSRKEGSRITRMRSPANIPPGGHFVKRGSPRFSHLFLIIEPPCLRRFSCRGSLPFLLGKTVELLEEDNSKQVPNEINKATGQLFHFQRNLLAGAHGLLALLNANCFVIRLLQWSQLTRC